MPSFIALLRGINVGGNKKVPMAQLKKLCESLGFTDVKTLLASGNVVFGAAGKPDAIKKKLEAAIEEEFGFTVDVIIRTAKEIKALIASDPFKGIKVTPDTLRYITFIQSKPKGTIRIPYASSDKSFRILKVSGGEAVSVLDISKSMGSVDAMKILEKEFGNNVTTRNWNTVGKLVDTSI